MEKHKFVGFVNFKAPDGVVKGWACTVQALYFVDAVDAVHHAALKYQREHEMFDHAVILMALRRGEASA